LDYAGAVLGEVRLMTAVERTGPADLGATAGRRVRIRPGQIAGYVGMVVAIGIVGLPLAWLPNNSPRYGKRATSTGLQLTFGNAAGVMSAFI